MRRQKPMFGLLAAVVAWSAIDPCAGAPSNARSDDQLQEWCAAQAKRVFQQMNLAAAEGDLYHSHYNIALNKCFMAIESRRGSVVVKSLLDAYAQRTYASYFVMSGANTLNQCVLMPGARDRKSCTADEYKAFVARFIGQ